MEIREVFQDVLKSFQSIPNFEVKFKVVRSKDYSVPQNRPRLLIVGFRRDVFQGTSSDIDAVSGGFLPPGRAQYPHMTEVLSDLIDHKFEYGGRTSEYPLPVQSEFQERMRRGKYGSLTLEDHEYSRHTEAVQRKFAFMIRTQGAIHHSHRTKKFNQRVLPKHWDKAGPNITITSLPDDLFT
jgi:DNA (cytosine-5)-methyltransferase 1